MGDLLLSRSPARGRAPCSPRARRRPTGDDRGPAAKRPRQRRRYPRSRGAAREEAACGSPTDGWYAPLEAASFAPPCEALLLLPPRSGRDRRFIQSLRGRARGGPGADPGDRRPRPRSQCAGRDPRAGTRILASPPRAELARLDPRAVAAAAARGEPGVRARRRFAPLLAARQRTSDKALSARSAGGQPGPPRRLASERRLDRADVAAPGRAGNRDRGLHRPDGPTGVARAREEAGRGGHRALGVDSGKIQFLVDAGADRSVIFGSFNWSRPSQRYNHEIGVIAHDLELFSAFADRWDVLAEQVRVHEGAQ